KGLYDTMIADQTPNSKPERILPEAFTSLKDKPLWLFSGPDKKPISPISGKSKGYLEPVNLGTFSAVEKYIAERPDHTAVIVLAPSAGLICIDLDNVVTETAELLPWAKEIVEELNSYTEWS